MNWFRTDPLPPGRLRPASAHILRIFAAQDLIVGARNEDALLDERLRVVPKAIVEQRVRFPGGAPRIEEMSLTLDEGIGFQAGLDPKVLLLLAQLDGARTLRQALAEAAKRDGAGDTDRYVRAGLPVARRMFELGFLERV